MEDRKRKATQSVDRGLLEREGEKSVPETAPAGENGCCPPERKTSWVLLSDGKAESGTFQVRIQQVENINYTHWMVKRSRLGLTHSGCLVETRRGSRVRQSTIIDPILLNNKPHIAIRNYCGLPIQIIAPEPSDGSAPRWVKYELTGSCWSGKKPWKPSTTGGQFVVQTVESGEWSDTHALTRHVDWVTRVAVLMQERLEIGFNVLRRNCQHVAAWTFNKINFESFDSQSSQIPACPPNSIFRLFRREWLPKPLSNDGISDSWVQLVEESLVPRPSAAAEAAVEVDAKAEDPQTRDTKDVKSKGKVTESGKGKCIESATLGSATGLGSADSVSDWELVPKKPVQSKESSGE